MWLQNFHHWLEIHCCCSVTKSCLILYDPMDWSQTAGSSVLHYLLEITQIHVHWVGDAIQPSHPLCPLLLLPSVFPGIRVYSNESAHRIRWKRISISSSNEYSGLISFRMDWFALLAVQRTLKSLMKAWIWERKEGDRTGRQQASRLVWRLVSFVVSVLN